jgi:hypothetical protein
MSIDKDAAAVAKIVANISEQYMLPQGAAPKVFRWVASDSPFRFLMFCLSTVHVVTAHRMKNPNAVLSECTEHMVKTAMDLSEEFFPYSPDREEAPRTGPRYLESFLEGWGEWTEATRRDPTNARAGTHVVCAMLRSIEAREPANDLDDYARLLPLAAWFEDWIPAIDDAFAKLARPWWAFGQH